MFDTKIYGYSYNCVTHKVEVLEIDVKETEKMYIGRGKRILKSSIGEIHYDYYKTMYLEERDRKYYLTELKKLMQDKIKDIKRHLEDAEEELRIVEGLN